MRELRIVNGLNRGVVFPLDDQPIVIGASLEADLILADPGIAGRHAKITPNDEGSAWFLEGLEGGIYDELGAPLNQVDITVNGIISLGGVWLQFANKDDAWLSDEVAFDLQKPKPVKRKSFLRPLFVVVLACAGVLTITHANVRGGLLPSKDIVELSSPSLEEASQQVVEEKTDFLATFKKMLKQREIQDIKIVVNDNHWSLEGSLESNNFAKLKRMLIRFKKYHPNDINISNNVVKVSDSLPFEIVKIIAGPYGHVESRDGHKLYLGNEYKGFKLISIQKNELVFYGKKQIKVRW